MDIRSLETKRLILRKPKISDWKDVVEGLNDIKVSKYLVVDPHPYRKKDASKLIEGTLKEWMHGNNFFHTFFIELKLEKKVIGAIGIYELFKENGTGTLGFWINRDYWRNGYVTEASISILDFAFKKIKLRRVDSGAYKENIASNIILKKLGFKFEGTRRKAFRSKADRKIHDNLSYGLLRDEWKKIRPKIVKDVNKRINKLK